MFDRTSGTEQLHCSNSGEPFCVAIAVSRTDSWYSGVLYTEQDESRQHANANISKLSSNIIYSFNLLQHTYIHTPFRFSDKNFVGNFDLSAMSHM